VTARPLSRKRSFGGCVGALLAGTLLTGMIAGAVPWAVQAAGAQTTMSCTFNGKAGPAAITGVVPGTTTLAIVCTGTSGLGLAGIMASPLGGVVVSPAKASDEADLGTLTKFTESPAGTYKATFKVPSSFKATDTNAVCPPSAGQFDAGLVGCPVAVINTASLAPFTGQEAILLDSSQTAPPNSPTLATSSSEVTAGETISFAEATGACPDNPTRSSDCWWGDALATSSTSSAPATLTVTLDGAAVAGATATVSGPGTNGLATYDGTTLVPQSLSGSLTLPSPLASGAHKLTVTQTNVTPFDGNGSSPHAGSPISASTTLFVGPTTAPVVTGVSPASGTSAGGTAVAISGSNFTAATAVHFGAAAAKSFKVNSSTSISATSPAGLGAVYVTVTTSKGTSLTSDGDRFVYVAPTAPVIASLSPSSGTEEGGTGVTVSGSGFTGSTSVRFGKTSAKSFKVISDTELVAVSPAGSGVVNLSITNPVGPSATTASDQYSYLPGGPGGPLVTGVDPSVGTAGTVVAVSGTGFSGATAVAFGTTAATSMTVVSDTAITATAPSGSPDGTTVDITVTTPIGTSATTGADQFSYVGPPIISSLSPDTGSPLGGYAITLNGSGFTGATAVDFGTTPATNFSVSGDSSITATAPLGTGTVYVRVTTPAGTSAKIAAAKFFYGAPTVASVSPNAGSPQGGYSVALTGTGFTGAVAVDFGTTPATNVVVSSDDTLTATVPAGSGTVHVTVRTNAGTSATSSADEFDYVATPTISGVSPNEGPTAGGNLVTISGTSLTGATAVDFGSTAATGITVLSDTSVTALVPAGSGTVDVNVTVPTGNTSASSPVQYTYVAVPTVTGVSPDSGLAQGGAPTVTVTGSGFTTATLVSFGPNGTGSFTFNSDSSISVTPPSSPSGAGPVDVTVTNPGGISATSAADVFTYEALPSVAGIEPDAGPVAGGTQVLVAGTGFTPSTTVDFGTVAASAVTVVNSTFIEATSPVPTGAGTVDITVTTSVGTSLTSGADQFTYQAAPTVTGLSPSSGPVGGGTSVTITGTNFQAATAVKFGATGSPSFTVDSSTSITATAPSSVTPGAVNVTVVTTSGTSAISTADHFVNLAVPTITGITPLAGPVSGGTSVTITGSGFTRPSAVSFGGVPAKSVTVVSATEITAVAPGQTTPAPFGATVNVTTPGGTAGNGSVGDTFTYTPVVPTITAVSPSRNTTAGDSQVTITGTGFTSDATVTFGADGASLSGASVLSPTTLTVNSPAGVPGTVNLVVSTSGGTTAITAQDEFTYVTETTNLIVTPETGNSSGDTVTVTGSGFPTGNWAVNNSGVILVQASPLATFLSGFSALNDLYTDNLAEPIVNNAGDFTTTFTLASPFTVGDPNGACPPLQYQVDMGLVGCAIVALSLNAVTFLANLGDVPVIYSGTQPDPPTLSVPSTVVHVGQTLNFSGTGWWGSYPGGGATADICGIGGNPATCDSVTGSGVVAGVAYSGSGGTLTGATVSGSIQVASDLAGCTSCFLTVTQPNLTPLPGTVTASLALTILPAVATVASVSPTDGPTGGGQKVTITGTGFTRATGVSFGKSPATSFTVKSSTEITATTPKHLAGVLDVKVTNAGGTSPTSVRDGYTFMPAPAVSGLAPNKGPTVGGTTVTITGTNLRGVTAVHFGSAAATSFAVKSDTEITATAPKHAVGKASITVTSPGGRSTNSPHTTYTYLAVPS
jgi:hypothetical protein